jgi:hypothetical protein
MMYRTLRRQAACALSYGLLMLAASNADAAYTTVKPPDPIDNEPNQELILEHLYGGNFTKSGANYSNGSVSALRIDDTLTTNGILGMIDGTPGPTTDQVWHDGFVNATAHARYARDQQSLGYWEGTAGGTYTNLFDIVGKGYDVEGEALLADMRGKTWRWGRSRGRGGLHSSLASENPDNLDHLVTYKLTGVPATLGQTVWLLFWEDLNYNPVPYSFTSDRDFNDFVVELRASTSVPEPTALAGVALAGLAALRRRRAR